MIAKGEDVVVSDYMRLVWHRFVVHQMVVGWAEQAVWGGRHIALSDDDCNEKVATGLRCDEPCLQAADATVGRTAFEMPTLPDGPVKAWECL